MPSTYVRLAMLYGTLQRTDDALAIVARGYDADPLWPMLPMTEVTVHFWRREFDEAVALGVNAVELHRYLPAGRTIYGQALEFLGRLDEALAQYRIASVMAPDLPWLRAHEGICLAKMGHADEARSLLLGLEQLRRSEYVDAYFMAVFLDAIGRRDDAFSELERAVIENSSRLYSIDVDPKIDGMRGDPRAGPNTERTEMIRSVVRPSVRRSPGTVGLDILMQLPATFDWASAVDTKALRRIVSGAEFLPLMAVGTGGSHGLIIQAAQTAGATVYSEDFSDGRHYGSIRVFNPLDRPAGS